jgi:hypothetical protein
MSCAQGSRRQSRAGSGRRLSGSPPQRAPSSFRTRARTRPALHVTLPSSTPCELCAESPCHTHTPTLSYTPHTHMYSCTSHTHTHTHTRRRSRHRYAYSFTRTSQVYGEKYRRFYRRYFEDTVHFLQSLELQRLLTRITHRKYELSVYFISRYTSGDL